VVWLKKAKLEKFEKKHSLKILPFSANECERLDTHFHRVLFLQNAAENLIITGFNMLWRHRSPPGAPPSRSIAAAQMNYAAKVYY
jgi:hypothetical protein